MVCIMSNDSNHGQLYILTDLVHVPYYAVLLLCILLANAVSHDPRKGYVKLDGNKHGIPNCLGQSPAVLNWIQVLQAHQVLYATKRNSSIHMPVLQELARSTCFCNQ
jgi:hypothetical protein